MMRLRLWVARQRDLLRMIDDAHAALRLSHADNLALSAAAVQLGDEIARLATTGDCPGRIEHVRLAARAERFERLWRERVSPSDVLTTLRFEEWTKR